MHQHNFTIEMELKVNVSFITGDGEMEGLSIEAVDLDKQPADIQQYVEELCETYLKNIWNCEQVDKAEHYHRLMQEIDPVNFRRAG